MRIFKSCLPLTFNIPCVHLLLLTLFFSCNLDNNSSADDTSKSKASLITNDNVAEYTLSFRNNLFDTTTTVIFRDTRDSISACQKRNFEQFVAKQDILMPQIMEEIFKYYQEAYPYYYKGWSSRSLLTKEEIEQHLPTPTTTEILKNHVEPAIVYIANRDDCENGTLGVYFTCTWDLEHDLGVVIKNWEVVQTGTGEIAFLFK